MSKFTEPLLITPLGHRKWQVKKAFSYDIDYEGSGKQVEIPYDFICDLGSIPKFAWSLVGHPLEDFPQEFVLHDRLYATGQYPRRFSDLLFFEAMWIRVCKAKSIKEKLRLQIKHFIFYAFVRSVFGGVAWRRHRKKGRVKA